MIDAAHVSTSVLHEQRTPAGHAAQQPGQKTLAEQQQQQAHQARLQEQRLQDAKLREQLLKHQAMLQYGLAGQLQHSSQASTTPQACSDLHKLPISPRAAMCGRWTGGLLGSVQHSGPAVRMVERKICRKLQSGEPCTVMVCLTCRKLDPAAALLLPFVGLLSAPDRHDGRTHSCADSRSCWESAPQLGQLGRTAISDVHPDGAVDSHADAVKNITHLSAPAPKLTGHKTSHRACDQTQLRPMTRLLVGLTRRLQTLPRLHKEEDPSTRLRLAWLRMSCSSACRCW